jgi:hypothetical protein
MPHRLYAAVRHIPANHPVVDTGPKMLAWTLRFESDGESSTLDVDMTSPDVAYASRGEPSNIIALATDVTNLRGHWQGAIVLGISPIRHGQVSFGISPVPPAGTHQHISGYLVFGSAA